MYDFLGVTRIYCQNIVKYSEKLKIELPARVQAPHRSLSLINLRPSIEKVRKQIIRKTQSIRCLKHILVYVFVGLYRCHAFQQLLVQQRPTSAVYSIYRI